MLATFEKKLSPVPETHLAELVLNPLSVIVGALGLVAGGTGLVRGTASRARRLSREKSDRHPKGEQSILRVPGGPGKGECLFLFAQNGETKRGKKKEEKSKTTRTRKTRGQKTGLHAELLENMRCKPAMGRTDAARVRLRRKQASKQKKAGDKKVRAAYV